MNSYTEDEAAKLWCPFVRYKSVRGEGINRWAGDGDEQDNPDPARCIGSRCMAWRWKLDEGKPVRDTLGRCGLVTK